MSTFHHNLNRSYHKPLLCITFQSILKIQNTWLMNHRWEYIAPKWGEKKKHLKTYMLLWIISNSWNFTRTSNSFTCFALLDFVAKLCTSHISLRGFARPTLLIQMNVARSLSFSIFEKVPCGMVPTPNCGMPRSCNN
jgi:hypothetical protein